ncbi:MAG TPA: (2Fe-2S) ferredoxin domain-containing protein [Clostridia bacterium]|jgi:NADP-reducing hydrogenase subunit HndB|nr:MAG: NADP-reducing hydrogenase subunit HndB [Firmicutes bacterium ADurb.Bin248]HOF99528.1 (2Fe-2S) ferredoxin domain-containing protein [Clostridia bacterium]HOS19004.1 (2Fe-2S) ferredoxin domain-containing protein [Clostridia bacterium]HPK15193.1 (2Fe-2S) ferredoxin domain-containing protein [Clostridia bacterium]
MKSIQELEAIRQKTLETINLRREQTGTRVVVGMATCGIAAGARPVLTAFMDEVAKRNLQGVAVAQTGCIGVCRLEPIVEIYKPGEDKVTYVKVTPDMVGRIVTEHVVGDNPVVEYTIGYYEAKNK